MFRIISGAKTTVVDFKFERHRTDKLLRSEIIIEEVQILRQFPELEYKYDRHPDQHIRLLQYGHYRIAYLIKSDDDIDVLDVFHGAIDIDRYLF